MFHLSLFFYFFSTDINPSVNEFFAFLENVGRDSNSQHFFFLLIMCSGRRPLVTNVNFLIFHQRTQLFLNLYNLFHFFFSFSFSVSFSPLMNGSHLPRAWKNCQENIRTFVLISSCRHNVKCTLKLFAKTGKLYA